MQNTFLTRLKLLFDRNTFGLLLAKHNSVFDELADERHRADEVEFDLRIARETITALNEKYADAMYRLENEKSRALIAEKKLKIVLSDEMREALNAKDYVKAYRLASPYIDEDGFALFWTAEKYTNINVYEHYGTEDNLGYFEESNGYELLSWLESAAFGSCDWVPVEGSCYEMAKNRTIDTESAEYQRYRNEICGIVLRDKLGIQLDAPVVAAGA